MAVRSRAHRGGVGQHRFGLDEHATGGGPPLFPCPGGGVGLFCFLPNPLLRPEVGKNKEVGLNLKYNDIFTSGDSFRGKFNVFRNDITDFILVSRRSEEFDVAVRAHHLHAQRFGSRAIVRRASHEERSTARIIGTVYAVTRAISSSVSPAAARSRGTSSRAGRP